MSDVLQTATKYQSQLKSELTKVDDFLRMANDFRENGEPSDGVEFLNTSPGSESGSAFPNGAAANGPRSMLHVN